MNALNTVNNVTSSVEVIFAELAKISGDYTSTITTAKGFTYDLVGCLVTVAEKYDADAEFAGEVNAYALKHGIRVPDLEKGENPYLHIVRMADMKEEPRTKPAKDGSTHYWKPNRSNEKHAAAVRLFRDNNIKGDRVRALLEGEAEITLLDGSRINNTLEEVMRADRARYAKTRAPVSISDTEKKAVAGMGPIASVQIPARYKGLVATNAEGFGAVIIRMVAGELEIVGDVGMEGDAITRLLKARLSQFQSERLEAIQTAERVVVQPDVAKEEVSA